ncbi:amidohydrolase family protein [Novosphingobium sp. PhB57]|jgi:predicted TIM-barrel fold metal-dependent hydrolase|uniref:amidohydrolase family protein n=1 Tax=unclassified Novosphingobium TaxID=2644732 RepID=UPI00104E6461|nr:MULTISPECIES: amidohydrolase family protein [unclassified Novosphingobium]TCU62171.1 amidohydrolase family protein [Novosphingobium sp. PhB57]TDW62788.1 amidohydrolase family protein [Novosphingobium sp. PhB55]
MADGDTKEMQESARKYWSAEGYTKGGVIREVDYATQSGGLDPTLEGIKIVDTDTHLSEPPTLFTDRAPVGLKAKMPFVKRDADGVDRWYIGDRNCGSLGGNVIRKDNNKLLGRLAFPTLEEAHPGGHEIAPRLKAMDDMGVYAQICFQNSGITQAGMLMTLGDDDLAVTIMKVFNDFNAEYQRDSGERLFPMAHLPFWNKAEMEKEARRCIDMGLRGFVLPDTPERVGVPSFNHEYWTPFLEMIDAEGISLNFHLNAAIDPNTLTWEGFAFEQTLSVVATMFSIGNAATLGNWMVSGRLDRHPNLKIGLIESGMGWVPFAVEALEHQFQEMLPSKRNVLKKQPWDYFRDHFKCTFWFEKIAPKLLLETIGVDNVMFETDFPHPTSLYPGVQAHIKDVLGGYDYAVKKKVLQDNAVNFYKLPF